MRSSFLSAAFFLLLLTQGCHVVEKNRLCRSLSSTLHASSEQLSRSIPANPSPQLLVERATQWEELSKTLELSTKGTKPLAKETKHLVTQLHKISEELHKASKAAQDFQKGSEAKKEKKNKHSPSSKAKKSKATDTKQRTSKRSSKKKKKEQAKLRRKHQLKRAARTRYQKAHKSITDQTRALKKTVAQLEKSCR